MTEEFDTIIIVEDGDSDSPQVIETVERGDPGPAGATGPVGATGSTGPPGATGANGSGGLILPVEQSIMGDTITLASTDGVIAGTGTINLPLISSQPETPQAFIISAYMGDITVVPHEDDEVIYTIDNDIVTELTIVDGTAIMLLRYANVWRVIFTSSNASHGTGIPIALRFTDPSQVTAMGGTIDSGMIELVALAALPLGTELWVDGENQGGFYAATSPGIFELSAGTQYLQGVDYVGQVISVAVDFGQSSVAGPLSSVWVIVADLSGIYARNITGHLRIGFDSIELLNTGSTITALNRVVASAGTINLPDAEEFGAGKPVAIVALGDLTVVPAGSDAVNGAGSLELVAGDVVVLYPLDISSLGIPAWNWTIESRYGPSFDIPGWHSVAEQKFLSVDGTGAPSWETIEIPDPEVDFGVVYNVRDYGAVGDGVADDTEAFEQVTALAADDPGVIFVPATNDAYMIRRRISLPSYTCLLGQGEASVIKRFQTVTSDITSSLASATDSFTVDDGSLFSVGDEVTISDPDNLEWNATHAIIESIDGNDITIDRQTVGGYSSSAVLRTQFPIVTNNATPGNTPAAASHGISVRHIRLEGNRGPNDPTDSALVDFTNSSIHWERGFHCVVDSVHFGSVIGDAYSDQARDPDVPDGSGTHTGNIIHNSHIDDSARHGVHIGSSTSGAQVNGNSISNCLNMAVFLCRMAQNTVIVGNTIENCRQGVAGSDAREPDDDPIANETPYSDIVGDIGTVVTGNTFIGGPINDNAQGMAAIYLGPQSVASGNTILKWNGGIYTVDNAVDCAITGNIISLSYEYSGNIGVRVGHGSHRTVVMGNNIRGGGDSPDVVSKQDIGIAVGEVDSCTLTGNTVVYTVYGYVFDGDASNVQFSHNTATNIQDPYGLIRVYYTLTDCSLELWGLDIEKSISDTLISYHDNVAGSAALGKAAQVRLVVNGSSDNGSDDPNVDGPWSFLDANSDHRREGVTVKWNDGSDHISQYRQGVGWIELTSEPGVPETRTINGKELDEDITLVADDVSAAPALAIGTPRLYGNATIHWTIPGVIPTAASTTTLSVNRPAFMPIRVARTTTFDRIGVEVTTLGSAGAVGRIAIYNVDDYWNLTTLVLDTGSYVVDAGSVPFVAGYQSDFQLTAGNYIVVAIHSGSPTLRSFTCYPPFDNFPMLETGASAFRGVSTLNNSSAIANGYPTPAGSLQWDRDISATAATLTYTVKMREKV